MKQRIITLTEARSVTAMNERMNKFLGEALKDGWVCLSVGMTLGPGGYACWLLMQEAAG